MNILFINIFCVAFMVSEIPRISVFGTVRIRLLSLILDNNVTYINNLSYVQMLGPSWIIPIIVVQHSTILII